MTKSKNPSISCIIPSVNRSSLFDDCLPSVLAQQYSFDEVIIAFDLPFNQSLHQRSLEYGVNACFTGGSKGGPHARHLAYKILDCDYNVILDDDDIILPDFNTELLKTLRQCIQNPSLIVPSLVKVWPEIYFIKTKYIPPHFLLPENLSNQPTDIVNQWNPISSSGLVISRFVFDQLPVNPSIKGFNDIQIWRAACLSGSPVVSSNNSYVIFNQMFLINRLTSSLDDRIINIQVAARHGISFSRKEVKSNLLDTCMSQSRTQFYRRNYLSGIKSLFFAFKYVNFMSLACVVKYGINLVFIIWLLFPFSRKS